MEFRFVHKLATAGLVPNILLRQSRSKAEELAKLFEIEGERLKISADAAKAQLAAQEARLSQSRAQRDLKRRHAAALSVRAGIDGVLQKLGEGPTLQVGQQLAAGANVARVADPTRLKAEIKIYETQAKDIQLGQAAVIDTHNGEVSGKVARIDPAVQNGTVTVEVTLEGRLPKGARPDLSVEGTIELERLDDVIYVGKPVNAGTDGKPVGLFKLQPNGREANRVQVRLGRSSVNAIEVLEGLAVGDQVILSDMSAWDAHDRVRLN